MEEQVTRPQWLPTDVRTPDRQWMNQENPIFYWGRTERTGYVARVAISTHERGAVPYALQTDSDRHILGDDTAILDLLNSDEFRAEYNLNPEPSP